MLNSVLLLDSITDADSLAGDRIVVSGSHGGLYPAAVASKWGIRAVLFNDAGIGLERAGVAGVLALDKIGMAAAGVDCHSCYIGSAQDMFERGRISVVNAVAAQLGVEEGMMVKKATGLFQNAVRPHSSMAPHKESRWETTLDKSGTVVRLLDSAALVDVQDDGQIIVTGSHGGLIGGDPARALKALAKIAVFNDAGIGIDEIGISRLPALEQRGVAAVTVDCTTARIGDARSAFNTGIISHTNPTARGMGATKGLALKVWLSNL